MNEYTVRVDGMECQGCERVIRSRLTDLPGVTDVVPDADTGEVRVYADPTRDRIRETIVDAGYDPST
ncbi:heavy-metal-associated domain-containing protein [Saliphagus sp. LR7]|uniref:heavy-metal-associated domain-containing protein n=1 Tax=Saliphagus sp. LR7 TaxID=2282654 RepID=UPI000DF75962|nr:heavy metal-associated domain-containing protein [Saliphagus sp. LR7]